LKASLALLTPVLLIAMTTTIAITPLKAAGTNSTSNNKVTANQTANTTSTNPTISSKNTTPTMNAGHQPTQAKINVVASFFPIYEFVKAVGGDRIDASVLVPIDAEPHNFDPTIQEMQLIQVKG